MENEDRVKRRTHFSERTIDQRHGAVNLPTYDLDGDGDLDFVALLSQEHEVVEAFINDGKASFHRELIWAAPDPAYGSSGLELVDLDGDGDQDVLMTNGDSFDREPSLIARCNGWKTRVHIPFRITQSVTCRVC